MIPQINKVYKRLNKKVLVSSILEIGEYAGVSNTWKGNYIRKDGSLGKKCSGYFYELTPFNHRYTVVTKVLFR